MARLGLRHFGLRAGLRAPALLALAALALCAAAPAHAAPILITDRNSSITIDPASPLGSSNWLVDSIQHLASRSYYFRVGSTGPEASISTLPISLGPTLSKAPLFNPTDNRLSIQYLDPAGQFNLTLVTTLTGSSPGSMLSTITETLRVVNLSNDTLSFNLFQFADFNLAGSAADDTLQFIAPNHFHQTDSMGVIFQALSTPAPTGFLFGDPAALLALMNDSSPTNLSTSSGPFGPDDAAFLAQFQFDLAPGEQFLLSQTMSINATAMPEPSTLALLAATFAAFLHRRPRRANPDTNAKH